MKSNLGSKVKHKIVGVGLVALCSLLVVFGVMSFIGGDGDTVSDRVDGGQGAITTSPQPTQVGESTKVNGNYVDYSSTNFTNYKDTKRVLFFHSKTCVVCKQIDTNMQASNIPEGVTLFKVSMEDNPELVQQYSVNIQSTFIEIDQAGNSIKNWNWLSNPSANGDSLLAEVI